ILNKSNNNNNNNQPLINNHIINYTQTQQHYENQNQPNPQKKNSNPYPISITNSTEEEEEEEEEETSSSYDQPSSSSISIHETNEYKVAIELELWKQNEQQKFKNELKMKEQELVKQLSKEWNKRDQERNSIFIKKVKELKALEDKVKKLVNDLENREQQLINDEEELKSRRNDLEREYRLKNSTIEDYEKCIREECRCNVEVATRKAEAADKKYKEIITELEREKQKYSHLSEEYETFKNKMKESTETKLTQELNQLKLDNEKQNKQLLALKKTKKYYKTEWIITLKELTKAKQILQEKLIKEREREKEKELKKKIEKVNESLSRRNSPNSLLLGKTNTKYPSNDDEIPIKLNDKETMASGQEGYPYLPNPMMNSPINSVPNGYNNNTMANSNDFSPPRSNGYVSTSPTNQPPPSQCPQSFNGNSPNQWYIQNAPPPTSDNVTQNLLHLITQVLLNNNNNNSNNGNNSNIINKNAVNNTKNNSSDSADVKDSKNNKNEEKESQNGNNTNNEKKITDEKEEERNIVDSMTTFNVKNLKRKINDKGVYIWGVSFDKKPKDWISFTHQPNLYMIPYHLMNQQLIPEINRLIDERDDLLNTEIYSENDDLIYGLNNRIYELKKKSII
ncbi:hypothetical protein PIROE2DRAFT_3534, partial [Piromyces sp. E2]